MEPSFEYYLKTYLMLMLRFNNGAPYIFQCAGGNNIKFFTCENIFHIILIKGLTDESNLFCGPHS